MLIDARQLPDGTSLDCDVCIVGAGAAGITLACELDGTELSVLLLEGGGLGFDKAAQELYEGETDPESRHSPPHMYRHRRFGGSTTIWGGRCVPLDPIDFEARDYVPHSGWPIRWADLLPYYAKAQVYCEAGAFDYTVSGSLGPDAAETIPGFRSPWFDGDRIERFSRPTDFGKANRAAIKASANVRALLHANCLRLESDPGGKRIVSAVIASGPERRLTVAARHFVLAAGGLETTRLLMASDRSRRGGIGNHSDRLGRFYMCHVESTLGTLRLRPGHTDAVFGFERTAEGVYLRRKFVLSEAAQRRYRLLNFIARFHHPSIVDPGHGNGILSAMYLAKDAILPEYRRKMTMIEHGKRRQVRRDARFWAGHLRNIVVDAPALMRFTAHWIDKRILAHRKLPYVALPSRFHAYPLDVNAEQVPNPDSRVRLSAETDRFGVPRLSVDWRLCEQDLTSLAATYRLMRDALAAAGCADLEFDDAALADHVREACPVGGHHIGTARMAEDPSQGVVDRHGAVFGVPNLFIAGSAVFPTCGHANPTLTIVALAIRLAGHLRHLNRLRSPSEPTRAAVPLESL